MSRFVNAEERGYSGNTVKTKRRISFELIDKRDALRKETEPGIRRNFNENTGIPYEYVEKPFVISLQLSLAYKTEDLMRAKWLARLRRSVERFETYEAYISRTYAKDISERTNVPHERVLRVFLSEENAKEVHRLSTEIKSLVLRLS